MKPGKFWNTCAAMTEKNNDSLIGRP